MLTRRFGIRGHGSGDALQAAYGLRFGLVDRFCAGRKRGTAHPACAGVPEAYLPHENSHWVNRTVTSAFASGSGMRPDTLVQSNGKTHGSVITAFRPEIRVDMVSFSPAAGPLSGTFRASTYLRPRERVVSSILGSRLSR